MTRRERPPGRAGNDVKINMPGYLFEPVVLAAAHGQLGERDAARVAVTRLVALMPDVATSGREEFGKWFDAELVEDLRTASGKPAWRFQIRATASGPARHQNSEI